MCASCTNTATDEVRADLGNRRGMRLTLNTTTYNIFILWPPDVCAGEKKKKKSKQVYDFVGALQSREEQRREMANRMKCYWCALFLALDVFLFLFA